jgi:hypothetical protein
MNLDLYFYEQIGSRYYLRITRLGLAAIMLLTVVPIMGILFLLAVNTNSPAKNTNVTITTLPASDPLPPTVIHQAPPPSFPKMRKRAVASLPQTITKPITNQSITNEQPSPQATQSLPGKFSN